MSECWADNMRVTDLGEGVSLFEREDGGDRADDHHEDGEQEHGVQHPVLAGDARHPPVANLRICDSEMFGLYSYVWLTTNFLCLMY